MWSLGQASRGSKSEKQSMINSIISGWYMKSYNVVNKFMPGGSKEDKEGKEILPL